jgi:transposase
MNAEPAPMVPLPSRTEAAYWECLARSKRCDSRLTKGSADDSRSILADRRAVFKIAPHLPTDTRGKARVDDRRVISGIVHVLKSGGRWIDAPPDYGPKKTLYNRYVRWAAKGVWVNHALAQAGGPPAQVLIDSSAVKAHRSASGGFRDIPKMRPDEFVWPGFESRGTAAIWAADPFIGREQALEIARPAETAGLDYYQRVLDSTSDPEIKTLAREFVAEERSHVAELDKWIAANKAGQTLTVDF